MSLLLRLRFNACVGALIAGAAWQATPGWSQTVPASASDSEDAVPAPAATTTAPRTRPPARWTLDIRATEDLADLLRAYLDISRYQQEVVDGEQVRVSRSELRRLVAASSHITMPIRYRRRRL